MSFLCGRFLSIVYIATYCMYIPLKDDEQGCMQTQLSIVDNKLAASSSLEGTSTACNIQERCRECLEKNFYKETWILAFERIVHIPVL